MSHRTKFDSDFSVLILAGGRGTRMSGRDKGLLALAGKPVIEHLLARLRPHSEHILISANRNADRYAAYGYPVITDTLDDFPGPLAGMLAGLTACRTEWLLVVPVDSPLISAAWPPRMLQCAQGEPVQACVAEFEGEVEPVFCLLNRALRASLQNYLQEGKRSARQWLELAGARRVDCSDMPEQFININREAELQALERRLQAGGEYESAV